MKSIFSIISRIQFRLSNNVVSDETIPLQLIEDTCNVTRLALAKKVSNKEKFYQKICCLPVECETVECDGMVLENIQVINVPNIALDFNIDIFTLSVKDKRNYIYLGKNKNKPSSKSRLSRQLKQRSFTVLDENKIVVYDDDPIEYLCVSAVFVNPYDALILGCSDIKTPRKDMDYPMPGSSILKLEELVYNRLTNRNYVNETDNGSKKIM